MLLRENLGQLWGFNRGTLIFLHPQCPITRTHIRQRETESYNILNCSNNKIYGNGLFCHNKWVAKRQGHRNLEFHMVNSLEPAPQTRTLETATAHLQTTWTVCFDGQGTQKLPCGKIPWGGGGEGGIGWLMVYQHPTKFHQATGTCVVFNTWVAQHPPQFHQATGLSSCSASTPVSPGNRFLCDITSHSTSTPVLPSNRFFSDITTTVTHPDHPFYHTTGLWVALIHHRLGIHPKSASTPRQ